MSAPETRSPVDKDLLRIFVVVAIIGPNLTMLAALVSGEALPPSFFVLPLASYAIGMIAVRYGTTIPVWLIEVLAAAATLLVTAAIRVGGFGIGESLAMFYIWVSLVSFCYLPLSGAVRQLVILMAGAALAAVTSPSVQAGASFWVMVSGTSAVAGMWMRQMMIRIRVLAEADAERAQAMAASRAKSEFLSRLSHELRTPLNAVLGFGELLRMEGTDGRQTELLDRIDMAGHHLADLIDEALEISRIEQGRIDLIVEAVDLETVLAEALTLVKPLTVRYPAQLPAAVDARGVSVIADRKRLVQILINLLSNAVKYNRPGGAVEVRVAATDTAVTVAVRDHGKGIPADRMSSLFIPFERLDADRTAIEGTGLGLSVARAVAEAMHASIAVASEVGEGTTFTLTLAPCPPAASRGARGAQRGDEPAAVAMTVLHIDDDPGNRALVREVLTHRPAVRLVEAIDGLSGLERATAEHPALILLDLHLPDIEGDEVLRRLRADPALADIPVVIMSAETAPEQQHRLIAAGAWQFLSKPVAVKDLLRVVDATAAPPS